jgi:hypothetical protein
MMIEPVNFPTGMRTQEFHRPAASALPSARSLPPQEEDDALDLFKSFYQTSEGNCVVVAGIKAGMSAFGTEGIFESVEKTDSGAIVKLRDGTEVRISNEDIELAKQESKIKGKDGDLIDEAVFAYAVAARNLADSQHDGDIKAAFKDMQDGMKHLSAVVWLGLSGNARQVDPSEAMAAEHGIVFSDTHAFYSSRNHVDRWGVDGEFDSNKTATYEPKDGIVIETQDPPKFALPETAVSQASIDRTRELMGSDNVKNLMRTMGPGHIETISEAGLDKVLRIFESKTPDEHGVLHAKIDGKDMQLTVDEVNAVNHFAKVRVNGTTMFDSIDGGDNWVGYAELYKALDDGGRWNIDTIRNG